MLHVHVGVSDQSVPSSHTGKKRARHRCCVTEARLHSANNTLCMQCGATCQEISCGLLLKSSMAAARGGSPFSGFVLSLSRHVHLSVRGGTETFSVASRAPCAVSLKVPPIHDVMNVDSTRLWTGTTSHCARAYPSRSKGDRIRRWRTGGSLSVRMVNESRRVQV